MSDPHPHDAPSSPSGTAARAAALEALLVDKGIITTEAVDAVVDLFERELGPHHGARIVARAWVDPAFKQRLLADAPSAAAELDAFQQNLVAVENTERVHNVVVCTPLLLLPVVGVGLATELVQERGVPIASRQRTAERVTRVRTGGAGLGAGPSVGFERGGPLLGGTATSGRHDRVERGSAGERRHPGRHDRHGNDPAAMSVADQPAVPFSEPWQARMVAVAVALAEETGNGWDHFSRHLNAAVAAERARPYFDSFLEALEEFVRELGYTMDAGVGAPEGG